MFLYCDEYAAIQTGGNMDITKLKQWRTRFRTELFDCVIPFWVKYAPDSEYGGIYSCLDRKGEIFSTDKSVWMQGRAAWTFSRLCNVYGIRPEWLSIAKSCIDFLDWHCVDSFDGRYYYSVTKDGRPLRKRRYYFSEVYSIAAHAEFALATGDLNSLENARRVHALTCQICFNPTSDPYYVTPKFISETRPTHNITKYLMLLEATTVLQRCDPEGLTHYNDIARKLIDEIVRYHYNQELCSLLETVGENGEFLKFYPAGRLINPGHSMLLSWELLDEAQWLQNESYNRIAANLFDWVISSCWDDSYGGLLYFKDVLNYPPEQYEHDMKIWWVICEAVLAALRLFALTKKQKYFEQFEMLSKYMLKYYPDHEYGEWYGYLRRDGLPTEPACKGNMYKGPYHIPRMLINLDLALTEIIKNEP